MGACAALGISNQDALSKDLEDDPFLCSSKIYLRSVLQIQFVLSSLKCWNLSEHNKNEEQTSGTEDKEKLVGSLYNPGSLGN